MKRYLWMLLFLLGVPSLLAQQRPLLTERAETLPRGEALFDIGIEFLQDAVFPFSGLNGDLTRAGVLGLRIGASDNVEIQVTGVVQNILDVNDRAPAPNTPNLTFSGNTTSDVGDFTLATKVRLLKEAEGVPTVSFRFGFTMPNASNEKGLGNDETGIFGSLLLGKSVGRARLIGNLGIAILGDPVEAGSQDDLFTYGAAVIYSLTPRFALLADINGRTGPNSVGNEDQTLLILGTQVEAGGLNWDGGFLVGLQDTDPDTGVIFGVSRRFRLFGR